MGSYKLVKYSSLQVVLSCIFSVTYFYIVNYVEYQAVDERQITATVSVSYTHSVCFTHVLVSYYPPIEGSLIIRFLCFILFRFITLISFQTYYLLTVCLIGQDSFKRFYSLGINLITFLVR